MPRIEAPELATYMNPTDHKKDTPSSSVDNIELIGP